MQDIFELEPNTNIPRNSYIASYPHIASYMAALGHFTEADFVRGCHMVYGWMPTILELHAGPQILSLSAAAALIEQARQTGELQEVELEALARVTNNSVVGLSKLLHFVSPDHFAIWDSKIYSFVHKKTPYNHRVNRVDAYRNYLEILVGLRSDPRFDLFHASVNNKTGYQVSALRALERVMFLNAPATNA